MYKSIKETAEKILGRPLKQEEGLPIEEIEKTEKRLQLKLPNILREFHLMVGNLTLITNSTERFLSLNEITCIDDKLVFTEEQTGIGRWGININERYKADAPIYICIEDQGGEKRIWLNEGVGITEFIHSTMFFQCAQATYEYSRFLGNYSFTGTILIGNEEKTINTLLQQLESEWEKVVNRNNLVIYWKNRRMSWFFTNREGKPDEIVMLASQTEDDYIALLKELGFYRGKDVNEPKQEG
ncbi:MAG: SMI1/KNR4 family protein [Prevotellaceae bacterium]|jgi:hypothetical protein|nr:SMI1/KNR4 family protein [Prevotellaceae bacterium]